MAKVFYRLLRKIRRNKLNEKLGKADEARALSQKLCHPEQSVLERILKENVLQNCKVTIQDVKRAEKIYGKSIPATKGRSVLVHHPSYIHTDLHYHRFLA